MIKDQPVQVFLEQLASQSATPGGGSAAAIMGGMSAALVSMVCNLTVGKKNYESVSPELADVLLQAEQLRERMTDMINADVEVFNQVMQAYSLPKTTDAEKMLRSEAIQQALKAATDVPLKCARACAEAIELSRIVAEKGNRNVISDAGVAVLAAQAALKSAALNVYINVGNIRDADFVARSQTELSAILNGSEQMTDDIYQLVKSKL